MHPANIPPTTHSGSPSCSSSLLHVYIERGRGKTLQTSNFYKCSQASKAGSRQPRSSLTHFCLVGNPKELPFLLHPASWMLFAEGMSLFGSSLPHPSGLSLTVAQAGVRMPLGPLAFQLPHSEWCAHLSQWTVCSRRVWVILKLGQRVIHLWRDQAISWWLFYLWDLIIIG